MTAQVSERLLYEGKAAVPLRSTPLTPWLQQQGKADIFQWTNTANWRGYVGTWEIADDRLHLVGLTGRLKDGSAASLDALFPNSGGRVLATWYSGTLCIPEGELVEYVHLGFASRYERDRLLEIENGVLVSSSVRENESVVRGDAHATPSNRNDRRGFVGRILEILRRH
jgi:hypothetical protein